MPASRKRSYENFMADSNPHSYSHETLKQIRIAGFDPTTEFSELGVQLFPHRGLKPSPSNRVGVDTLEEDENTNAQNRENFDGDDAPRFFSTGAEDGNGDVGDRDAPKGHGRRQTKEKKAREKSDRTLGPQMRVLRAIINRSLREGKIERAKQTWAALLRTTRIGGKPPDLRDGGLWYLGAEVLMRDGEDTIDIQPRQAQSQAQIQTQSRETQAQIQIQIQNEPTNPSSSSPQPQKHNQDLNPFSQTHVSHFNPPPRWGRPENIMKVKSYYDTLSRKHPYTYGDSWRANALDFEESKFACEIYNAQIEHRIASWRIKEELGPKILRLTLAERARILRAKAKKEREREEREEAQKVETERAMEKVKKRMQLEEMQMGMKSERPDPIEEEDVEVEDDGVGLGFGGGGGGGGDDDDDDVYGDEWDNDPDFRAYQEQYGHPGDDDPVEYNYGNDDYKTEPPSAQQHPVLAPDSPQDINAGYDPTAYYQAQDRLNATAIDMSRDISERMDHIMVAHPFSAYLPVMKLRGMLALWTADLFVPSKMLPLSGLNTLEGRMERLVIDADIEGRGQGFQMERERALSKAREMFAKIEDMGGCVELMYREYAQQDREAREHDVRFNDGPGSLHGEYMA
ncbi:hypothetical protein MKZ38_003204 [Zalerion maritima]|uniref:Uncharacterized protein n=1 Tax=Zalerion maritima TaxID=339359 RepID=A0AAD5WVL8_9PEZI|nr:hypothetical protein MKZ38_003204 [Zalerion maritima]